MHPEVHSAIVGIRSVEQLDGIERAAELELSAEVMARLDVIFDINHGRPLKKARLPKRIRGNKDDTVMDLGIKGKVAAITGGSVGIGLAIAQGLAEEGVNLAICARDEERVTRVAKTIGEACGVKAIGIRADVSKVEDVNRFVAVIENEFGGADFLINNAGTGSEETILNASDEKWQYYWDLHVMAAVRLSRALSPLMQSR